jgi:hypothetical protein
MPNRECALVRWYLEPALPFLGVITALLLVTALAVWAIRVAPPPGKRMQIPHEWTCASKYQGGWCDRTGGVGPNGPWGTEKPTH